MNKQPYVSLVTRSADTTHSSPQCSIRVLKAVVTSVVHAVSRLLRCKVAGWTSDRYMPRIRDVYGNDADKLPFDFYEVLAAIAPRGVYSSSPTRDSNL